MSRNPFLWFFPYLRIILNASQGDNTLVALFFPFNYSDFQSLSMSPASFDWELDPVSRHVQM